MTEFQKLINGPDAHWFRQLDRATERLTIHDSFAADWVKIVQKFVPCSRRGTHRSLRDCPLCAGDVLRGDATADDVLLPKHLRGDLPGQQRGFDA